MKSLLALCLALSATLAWAEIAPVTAPPAPADKAVPASVSGQVLETRDVESYTYLRLKTGDGEIWAAVDKVTLTPGTDVTIENIVVMTDFESKALQQTFPRILFGTLGGAAGLAPATPGELAAAHAGINKAEVAGEIKVAKAVGENAYTVAEIIAKCGELKDKPVLLRGKVVKYNPYIMGRNWLHLRDGTGSAADRSNDILVTTAERAKLAEEVTVRGIVRTDVDFGAGYAYKVLIEEATIAK